MGKIIIDSALWPYRSFIKNLSLVIVCIHVWVFQGFLIDIAEVEQVAILLLSIVKLINHYLKAVYYIHIHENIVYLTVDVVIRIKLIVDSILKIIYLVFITYPDIVVRRIRLDFSRIDMDIRVFKRDEKDILKGLIRI